MTDETTVLGTGTAQVEDAPDCTGVDVILPPEVTDVLGLEDGDNVKVSIKADLDGEIAIHAEMEDVDLTDEQRAALQDLLEDGE